MRKFRKKPVVIEAYECTEETVIHTLEGDLTAQVGDFIITGVHGEKYPCKPDIFWETYEEVNDDVYILNACPYCRGTPRLFKDDINYHHIECLICHTVMAGNVTVQHLIETWNDWRNRKEMKYE